VLSYFVYNVTVPYLFSTKPLKLSHLFQTVLYFRTVVTVALMMIMGMMKTMHGMIKTIHGDDEENAWG
jgi:hypothetical protein